MGKVLLREEYCDADLVGGCSGTYWCGRALSRTSGFGSYLSSNLDTNLSTSNSPSSMPFTLMTIHICSAAQLHTVRPSSHSCNTPPSYALARLMLEEEAGDDGDDRNPLARRDRQTSNPTFTNSSCCYHPITTLHSELLLR